MESNRVLILTGAGFTANFGGLLGKQIYYEFYNGLKCRKVKELALEWESDHNYETAYSEIIYGNYKDEEKADAAAAMETVYKGLDDIIRGNVQDSQLHGYIYRFIRRLLGNGQKIGYFFTLNQDLFVERHLYGMPDLDINPLGTRRFSFDPISHNPDPFPIPLESDVGRINNKIASVLKPSLKKQDIHYIKMHGSYGWLSSTGSKAMVVGAQKEELINKEPLLKIYFEIFEKEIKEKNRRLLIIGYGFRDKHINKIIQDGCANGLKVFVIDPDPPNPEMISVEKFWPYDLRKIFPFNTYRPIAEEIINCLEAD